ncbi:MAG: phosphogluconate dehydratase [Candidatus Azotimanducaceae bacterium]|jgi:phosphogluconate dehydratase
MLNIQVEAVTARIRARSQAGRQHYLALCHETMTQHPPRQRLSCGNLAHGFAACGENDKQAIRLMQSANIGIVSAYNDVLSAHQPMAVYPDQIKAVAQRIGSTAQVAGGVPAMCDGVTQGQPGMELSLFSRDVIAMATAISLSHNLFDAVMCLGVCDKIVPGMLIGALQFGHLPAVFVPAGPMPSGLPNKEKARVRQRYAEGKATPDELLAAESASYHSPGTCTFYGTANSNQVLMEMLGVQLPGASFVNPDTALRAALTNEAVIRVVDASAAASRPKPLTEIVTEASFVNAMVALLATGGSTNHTLHLLAMAQAAGIELAWRDFDDLSRVVPLLARVYPNGDADINDFQDAGGMAFLVRELRGAGLLNEDVVTLMGDGLASHECAPKLSSDGERVEWSDRVETSMRPDVLAPVSEPFDPEGGLRLLTGNLGEGVIKVSAVAAEHRRVEAPCRIFDCQDDIAAAFEAGDLARDVIVVVRFQGPRSNGMPELHKLTPHLGILQDRGFKVALVTDGRMSGASGRVPAAIHMSPESERGGPLARLRDGDIVVLDADAGTLEVRISFAELQQRALATPPKVAETLGRRLFRTFRRDVSLSSEGASVMPL